MNYDDWRVNGEWHKCECGAEWSDSDGGPCHERCKHCGELIEALESCECPSGRIDYLEEAWASLAKRNNEIMAQVVALQMENARLQLEAKA